MGLLDGQVVLITGGARGQGRAHAIASAREGADVVVIDVAAPIDTVEYPLASPTDLAETVEAVGATGRRALALTADTRHQDELDRAVDAALEEFGRIDALVANAGIWTRAPFWTMPESVWQQTIDVNLSGAWRSAKAVTPHMIERGTGSIVLIASVAAKEATADQANYAAAKHGLLGLMKSIAAELAPHGIRCNALCPGAVDTPMTNNAANWDRYAGHAGGTVDDMMEAGYRYHALKGMSWLPPEAIADAALFLNSRGASAITGVAVPVDAGHLLLPGQNPDPVRIPAATGEAAPAAGR